MLQVLTKLFRAATRRTPMVRDPRRRSAPLAIESLETRLMPIVGAWAIPAADTAFTGVVQVNGNSSGTLLWTGRHILTAAHCVDSNLDGMVDAGTTSVQFDLPLGKRVIGSIPSSSIRLAPGWNGDYGNAGNDLAIITLPEVAPSGFFGASRHEIYRNADEIGQVFTVVGYGRTGIGDGGAAPGTFGTRRVGFNRFDAVGSDADGPVSALAFDFDNGDSDNDALGDLYDIDGTGIGASEASTAPGDSGGPSFLAGKIAGVTSFGLGFDDEPDISPGVNSSFGEIAFNTRVSSFTGFIDSTVAGAYDLVLDMRHQPLGNDGFKDTTTLRRLGNQLWLQGNGLEAYHVDDVSNIKSVSIIGSGDDDVLVLDLSGGDLVPGGGIVTFDGHWGDEVYVTGGTAGETIRLSGTELTLSGNGLSDKLQFGSASRVTLATNGGADAIHIDNAPSTVSQLTIDTGGDNDTITLRKTSPSTVTDVASGGERDIVNLGNTDSRLDDLQGPITLHGNDGTDDGLRIWDLGTTSGKTYTVAAGSLQRTGTPTITLDGLEDIQIWAGTGADKLVRADSTACSWLVTAANAGRVGPVTFWSIENLTGGAGADYFVFDPGARVDGIVNGKGGEDWLNYGKFPSSAAVVVNLQTQTATATNGIVDIDAVQGGAGADTLFGPDGAATWAVTGSNFSKLTGTLFGKPNSTFRIEGVESLQGGAGADLFVMSPAGKLDGSITGGNGAKDTLSYAPCTADVVVVLGGSATNVGGGNRGFENLVGGAGHDTLRGNGDDNLIRGGGGNDSLWGDWGNDILLGEAGNDTLYGGLGSDLLFGGLGQSILDGGWNDDLLIAGTTKYDNDDTALLAIFKEWTRLDASYLTRLDHLRGVKSGGLNGTFYLNTNTVLVASGKHRLVGDTGSDWFWALASQTDQEPGEKLGMAG